MTLPLTQFILNPYYGRLLLGRHKIILFYKNFVTCRIHIGHLLNPAWNLVSTLKLLNQTSLQGIGILITISFCWYCTVHPFNREAAKLFINSEAQYLGKKLSWINIRSRGCWCFEITDLFQTGKIIRAVVGLCHLNAVHYWACILWNHAGVDIVWGERDNFPAIILRILVVEDHKSFDIVECVMSLTIIIIGLGNEHFYVFSERLEVGIQCAHPPYLPSFATNTLWVQD